MMEHLKFLVVGTLGIWAAVFAVLLASKGDWRIFAAGGTLIVGYAVGSLLLGKGGNHEE